MGGIGIRIIKLPLQAIAQSLTHIYNTNITSAIFPDNFKKARLSPVFKKDLPQVRNNHRPIFVLPIVSKPLDKHVALSYLIFLSCHDLLHCKQPVYHETALLSLSDNWLNTMDNSKLVDVVFLDLSKAFDLFNHDILSKIAKYHASESIQRWFRFYLYNRTQRCAISGSLSDRLILTQGVPQGSILGPILFCFYINDPAFCLQTNEVDVEIYTDDTTLWTSQYT